MQMHALIELCGGFESACADEIMQALLEIMNLFVDRVQ